MSSVEDAVERAADTVDSRIDRALDKFFDFEWKIPDLPSPDEVTRNIDKSLDDFFGAFDWKFIEERIEQATAPASVGTFNPALLGRIGAESQLGEIARQQEETNRILRKGFRDTGAVWH
jgi:hypothetical protein